MFKAAIISKPQKPELSLILRELLGWLAAHNYEALLDPVSAAYVEAPHSIERDQMPQHGPQVVVVLGGDGTLLAAARAFARTPTPILGVNLGSLGFLTEVPLSELYTSLEAWCANCANIEKRDMIRAELHRNGQMLQCWDALNDVVVANGSIARIADFSIEIDQQLAAVIRADGIIVATPTGSTAYNLSAGGPIVMPSVNAHVVTPLCPHVLTIRPFVVPGDSTIAINVEGAPEGTSFTVDGQQTVELELGDKVICKRSEYQVSLLRPHHNGLFSVLRNKLSWSER